MKEQIQKQVQDFASHTSQLPKIVVIFWPTASGKTALSLSVAQMLGTEIISCDSRQVYTGMDIGTGKIRPEEMWWVQHHMLDILVPSEPYSTGEYVQAVEPIIDALHATWRIPVICWGTGLYIDSLVFQFDIPAVPADWKFRHELEDFRQQHWNEALWQRLHAVDAAYAAELHVNNYRYVMRWLEILRATGVSKKTLKTTKQKKYDVLLVTPFAWEREELYARINTRVIGMFDEGLEDEVQKLLKMYGPDAPGLRAIGYSEVIQYLTWGCTSDQMVTQVQQHSRNYAKRQLTWFRKYMQ